MGCMVVKDFTTGTKPSLNLKGSLFSLSSSFIRRMSMLFIAKYVQKESIFC